MQPNLLNSISVEIKQIDEDNTVYSNSRREPANRVKRFAAFKINVQLYIGEMAMLSSTKGKNPNERNLGGNILDAKGYIIVRKKDLSSKGKTLKEGDKISSYGKIGKEIYCDYYLIGKKDAAHYSDIGQCTLEQWFFEDRK